jgi:predicted glycosyltransferase
MRAIARGLSRAHTVHLVDGGRPVPGSQDGSEPARIPLPVIFRRAGALVAAGGSSVSAMLAERARTLSRIVTDLRPQAVLVDHYPFSKWELEGEIVEAIQAARRSEPSTLILCSLRDIAPRTGHEPPSDERYEDRVLALVRAHFDGILVHADPSFTRLEEHFTRAADLPVPVHYTGFVAEESAPVASSGEAGPWAVLSCGGGTRSLEFLLLAIAAFRRISDAGLTGAMRLHVFPGAFADERELDALRAAANDARVHVAAFSGDFASRLRASALSISRAGYNTTVQLLQSRVPAVVVPDRGMSDQGPRARRLGELGLAQVVTSDPPEVGALATAMTQALARSPQPHALQLGGVAGTRALLERLYMEHNGSWPSTPTSDSPDTSR